MKIVFLSFFYFLLFSYSLNSLAQCDGFIILQNQEEVDDFPTNYGCSVIEGNLRIIGNGSISNLLALEGITSIEGELKITDNHILTNLEGLHNITNIEGDLTISDNSALTNIDELQNATGSLDYLIIENNNSLTNIDGLQNLVDSVNFVYLTNNNSLNNVNGLQNLTNIAQYTSIERNDALTNLEGLQNLTNIGGTLNIDNNNSLINIDGLQNLVGIGGNLIIANNNSLSNLNGLQSLTNLQANLYLWKNGSLVNIEGLQNITTVSGFLRIRDNDALPNIIDGLQNLTTVIGSLTIEENEVLTNVNGLQSITSILGDLNIEDNPILEGCCYILPLLDGALGGSTYINNNQPACEDYQTIISFCSKVDIQAQAFYDENENGLFDGNEQTIQQTFSLSPFGYFVFSDNQGITYFHVEEFGTYTLSLEDNPLWTFTGGSPNIEVVFEGPNFGDTVNYFPVVPIADFTIQDIDLTSSITRCNQETNYWLSYANKGTTINDGSIQLVADELATFVSANPPVDSTAGDTLYWFYEDLFPTHTNQIHLIYEMPSVEELGTEIAFEAQIQTNEGFGDAKTNLSSELICAYDPNDKLVSPFGYGEDNYTLLGDTLEYTVRFQNTGNDTAFTVLIEDQLSEHLNLNTFRPVASSHNVETQIDVNTRLATFTFQDIYLPDSFVNEPASHGFVKYQILAKDGLTENTDIQNTASIFFDQNPAIVTNTVSNRMVSELPDLPILAASPFELNFGEVALDESAYLPQILTIENPGDLPLHIQQFNFENLAFNSDEIETITIEGQNSIDVPIYFEPTEIGNYQSELVLQSNSGDFSIALNGTANLATGIQNIQEPSFSLFPNPNNGRFYLQNNNGDILSFQIFNSLGELILEEEIIGTSTEINLDSYNKEIYFLSLQTKEGVFVEKVIVQ